MSERGSPAGHWKKKPRVLVAGDDAGMRHQVQGLLTGHYDVEACADGKAALIAARAERPDLVVTDVTMPELDGFGLLRELRKDPLTATVPIILLSTRAGEEARVEGLEAGADDYLTRPLNARELLARVASHLELGRVRRAALLREQELLADANAAKDRLEKVLGSISDLFLTLDRELRCTSVNERLVALVGMPRRKLLGMPIRTIFPETGENRFESQLRRAVNEQVPLHFEYCHLPSGRWFENRAYPSAEGITLIIAEITERKRADDAIRLANEQTERSLAEMEAIVSNMTEGLVVAGPDGKVLMCNPAALAIYGLQSDEVVGHTFQEFQNEHTLYALDGRELSAGEWPIARALAGEVFSGYEVRIARSEARREWIASYGGAPVRDRTGRLLCAIVTFRDVTRQKRGEEALREADRRKDEFLAMLAHELRNPLAPVRNAVQVLKMISPSSPIFDQARDLIDRQVGHMARLIDDLLDVSRISRGKFLLRKGPLDLVPLVRSAVEDHRSLLAASGLEVVLALPEEPIFVVGDPTRLAQVVGNLLHNANKFTDPGGEVRVQLRAEGRDAVLSVRDTGVGIDPDLLSRLFVPFTQAERSLARSRGGLGLGLALVKGLVDLHGGTVEARSTGPDQGSEFILRLPRTKTVEHGPTSPVPEPPKQSLRIVVIEDHLDVAESLRLLLELNGHHVSVGHTGVAGVELVARVEPDLVLCDIGLPGGMDGFDVARSLRAHYPSSRPTLIALSGYGQEEDQERAREAGFDLHLTKPIDPLALTKLLNAIPVRHR